MTGYSSRKLPEDSQETSMITLITKVSKTVLQ